MKLTKVRAVPGTRAVGAALAVRAVWAVRAVLAVRALPSLRSLRALAVAGACVLCGSLQPALAAPPHEHGVARLDVASAPTRVTLHLEVPLDSLLGFEHAPQNAEEHKQADLVVTRLRTGGALFRIDAAAHCTPGRVDLQSAALGLGAALGATDGHADVVANYDFICQDGTRAAFVEVGLFDFFPRLQRVDVQTSTRRGQMQARLKRPVTRLPLAR